MMDAAYRRPSNLCRYLFAIVCMLSASMAAAAVTCTTSATGVAFGTYNPLQGTPTASTGTVTVTCSATGSSATVTLLVSLSTGMSGTFSPRRMFSGTNTLNYNLYFSTAYTQIWGNGTGGTFRGTATMFVTRGSPRTVSGTLYGMMPSGQDVAAGSYADSIVVTVTY